MAKSTADLEDRIRQRGETFFDLVRQETPSLFNKSRWTGAMLDWCMKNREFKTQLLRFVDVFPYLNDTDQLVRHVREYFAGRDNEEIPAVLKLGAKGAHWGGRWGASLLEKSIRYNIRELARQFIIGEHADETVRNLEQQRREGFAFVVAVLGETAVSEAEADAYQRRYLDLIHSLDQAARQWQPLAIVRKSPDEESPSDSDRSAKLDWGFAPLNQIAVKCTALYSRTRPSDFEGSVAGILKRLEPICRAAMETGATLALDMESYQTKEIVLEVFRRVRAKPEFRDYPHLALVLQSYLRDTDDDLDRLLAWARKEKLPLQIRLVKGAYWDYEVAKAGQNHWRCPVWRLKAETDAAFERQARKILENHDRCFFACGSHNIRSIAATIETARELGVPDDRYEFQVLYGMAEPVRKALQQMAGRVRLYAPYGEMIPGMAYLVRRLLENTSNESFVRQTFVEDRETARLLANPADEFRDNDQNTDLEDNPVSTTKTARPTNRDLFQNHPKIDFTQLEARTVFPKEISRIRRKFLGRTYPLHIDGQSVNTDDLLDSVNPNHPEEIIGRVCQAGTDQVGQAIQGASRAFSDWRNTPPETRADYLRRAAWIMQDRIYELAAWQVLEAGKQWDQAHADVVEAIDFLNYYAQQMLRLGKPLPMGDVPAESNFYFYEPRGVTAVIAPWNFPLAISTGMTSAAIVTGNCVVYKPSSLSSIIGHQLVEIFSEAGFPKGVFNYLPGRSRVMGDDLVEHPDISTIVFTGSKEIGLRILQKAAVLQTGQSHIKRVIAEMGGKNAIIIDDDADLDEAVPGVLQSAFGYQGQKCSACSRVIVLDAIYDRFVQRLTAAARSMKIGPSEDPAHDMGAVIDKQAQQKILEYARLAKQEGRLLYESDCPKDAYYTPLTIVEGIEPQHRIAQEEVFGPVLAVMRVRDFSQAVEWANATPYALTGAVYSRSPGNLDRARREFRVGNLYLNQGCTGSIVGRQAFGGFRMSGVGSKAGGPDYLLQFMEPRVVTENTMRRGFTPEIG